MSSDTPDRVAASPRRFTGVLVGGLLAGVLDITYVCVFAGLERDEFFWPALVSPSFSEYRGLAAGRD